MREFQASIWQEGELYVAQCLDIDIASQGTTAAEALSNLRDALELFFETASTSEAENRLRQGVTVSRFEVAVG
jgi:predicted RNase H-like HicB family nuclease